MTDPNDIKSQITIKPAPTKSSKYKTLGTSTLSLPKHLPSDKCFSPPPSPSRRLVFESRYDGVPGEFPDLQNLQLPVVKEIGIKACIEQLAPAFNCIQYKYNYAHFWMLDVVTDCIWMCQDRFAFPEDIQKVVLSWLLYAFELIRGES